MNISMTKSDVDDWHRFGKCAKSTIVWFVNRKHYHAILSKKFETSHIDKSKLGFEANVTIACK